MSQALQLPASFPHARDRVDLLVKQHLQIADEPLLLAIYYAPERDSPDIFVFEVAENFGFGSVDEERNLFEVTYTSRDTFPLDDGQRLHLILTNPQEMETAFREGWPLAREVLDAVKHNRFEIAYSAPKAAPPLETIGA